jgi:hypothetical protein
MAEATHLERSRDTLQQLVDRVLRSAHFSRAPRLSEFLRFICEETLAGREAALHEQAIGERVFDRKAGYSPADDNIVRVSARELRQRLQAYFDAAGEAESIVIEVPKGGYVPVFVDRAVPLNGGSPSAQSHILPTNPGSLPIAVTPATSRLPWAFWRVTAALVSGFVLGSLATWWIARPQPPSPLWAKLFDGQRPTVLVVADSVFSALQDLTNQEFGAEEYANRDYLRYLHQEANAGRINPLLPQIAQRQYTSLADALLVGRILQQHSAFRQRTSVRFARHLDQRELRFSNAILIGSPRSNPWTGLFASQLNFRFEFDRESRIPIVRSLRPLNGEQSVYSQTGAPSPEAFAVVALLRNLSGAGHALLISGTNMEATEAAGEWALSPEVMEPALRRFGMTPENIAPFEALLRVRATAGSPFRSELAAFRRAGAM